MTRINTDKYSVLILENLGQSVAFHSSPFYAEIPAFGGCRCPAVYS
jgi:hypothetical protein